MKKGKYNVRFYRVYDRIMLRYVGVMPLTETKAEKLEIQRKWVCIPV